MLDPACSDSDASPAVARIVAGNPGEPCGCGCGRKLCEWDACTHLTGRQGRFASDACKNGWYETNRPRIASAAAGAPRQGSIKAAVLGILHDREWHSAHDLAAKVKADKHSVVTRLSELRRAGFPIECDPPCGNARRPHRFRLAVGHV